MSLQENLRSLRERAGYTQAKDFAEKTLKMSYSTYMGYETRGTWPNEETLIKIANALHVTTDELLGYQVDVLGKCKQFAHEAGWNVDEFPDAIMVYVDLHDLGITPENPAPFEDFYKQSTDGIVPTLMSKEDFVEIFLTAKKQTDNILNSSRIIVAKKLLAITLLARVHQIINDQKDNPTVKETTDNREAV